MLTHVNGEWFGAPEAGVDMQFDFSQLVAHVARTRPLVAGTIVGSGTIANEDTSLGASCFAEKRTVETLEQGKPVTPFMSFGDTRSEEHTSELQSLMRISYAVFCLKKKKKQNSNKT